MFNLVKGTHDVILNEADKYSFVENMFIDIARRYNYKEFRTPIIEYSELFSRSVGDSSDIVRKEMYTFLDKGNRSITLRPELTAGIIRSMVTNKLFVNQDYPIKAFYVGPCFRYERPQTGRYRQFNQFGVECVGVSTPLRDAEVILLGYKALKKLNFENLTLKINTLGDEETRTNYKNALKEYFKPYLETMCDDCKSRFELNVLRILDCKVPSDQEIVKNAPKITDYLSETAKTNFKEILRILEKNNVKYELDYNLVRGLDYYSGVVFEFHYKGESNKDFGALGGGGHYNNLVKEVGGPEVEGIGFSFGIERVVSILNELDAFEDSQIELHAYIMPIGEENQEYALNLAEELRDNGFEIDVSLENKGMSQMFKKATRRKALYAIIFGENEIQNNEFGLKNLLTEEQITIKKEELIDVLTKLLGGGCSCDHDHDHEEGHECCCKRSD